MNNIPHLTWIIFALLFIRCNNPGGTSSKPVIDRVVPLQDSIYTGIAEDTDSLSSNKLSVLILPPYDEIANEGISPDVQKYLEYQTGKDTGFNLIKFPYRELMHIPYYQVFDKKYAQPILEKVNADILLMSKLTLVNRAGKMEDDRWNLSIKIYNKNTDVQMNASLKADSLTNEQIRIMLGARFPQLMNEIKSTCR